VTPVAFIGTHDASEGSLVCRQVDPVELAKGIRWAVKLSQLLEELAL
jgi:hypothetical protein